MNTPPLGGQHMFPGEHASNGSRNPLCTDLSAWRWRNPLNVLPLGVVLAVVVSLVLLLG